MMKEVGRYDSRSRFAVDLLSDAFQKSNKESANVKAIATGAGLVSEVYQIQLNKTGYSSSVIAKIPNYAYTKCPSSPRNNSIESDEEEEDEMSEPSERNRRLVTELHNREVTFYRFSTLNGNPELKIPQFYHGDLIGDGQQGLILMEDFTQHMTTLSNSLTLSVHQVESLVDQISLLQSMTTESMESFSLLPMQLEALSRCMLMSIDVISHRRLPWLTAKLRKELQCMAIPSNLQKLILLEDEERVLVHGDFWSKDTLWQQDERLLAIIDWQCVHMGSATTDLATIIGVNLPADERRREEMSLIRRFWETSQRCGRLWSFEMIESNYRKSLKLAALKLLVALVINPEADVSSDECPEGILSTRLNHLVGDVFA